MIFDHEHIETSLAKAKELRRTAEPLITLAKNDTLMRRRLAYSRIGFSPDGSSTYFLPRIIGIRKMMDLMITNRVLSAEEALDWGLISRIVTEDSLIEEGQKIVELIGRGATSAIGMAKKLLASTFEQSLESQMALEHLGIATMSRTNDCREGFTAFIDKRDPKFTGR